MNIHYMCQLVIIVRVIFLNAYRLTGLLVQLVLLLCGLGNQSQTCINISAVNIVFFSIMSKRRCGNNPKVLHDICGNYTAKKGHHRFYKKSLVYTYFKVKMGDQNKVWSLKKVCPYCVGRLRWGRKHAYHFQFLWHGGTLKTMSMAVVSH